MLGARATDAEVSVPPQVGQLGVHGDAQPFGADVIKERHDPENELLDLFSIDDAALPMEG